MSVWMKQRAVVDFAQVVMSSSIGELVVAIRMNFAKVEKLTQKPAAMASLRFFTKQVGLALICLWRILTFALTISNSSSLRRFKACHQRILVFCNGHYFNFCKVIAVRYSKSSYAFINSL